MFGLDVGSCGKASGYIRLLRRRVAFLLLAVIATIFLLVEEYRVHIVQQSNDTPHWDDAKDRLPRSLLEIVKAPPVFPEKNATSGAIPSSAVRELARVHSMEPCSYKIIHRDMKGHIPIVEEGVKAGHLAMVAKTVSNGGSYVPYECAPIYRVALIIPYRNRKAHRDVFLYHMHPFLQKQKIHYQIFLIEQLDKEPFNRGMLFNIGYESARKSGDFNCFIFADIDLLPMNDHLMYDCTNSPKHMAAYVDKLHPIYLEKTIPILNFIGGVVAFTDAHFQDINGFSNIYFGWGGEDDDLGKRLRSKSYHIHRLIKERHEVIPISAPEEMTMYAHYHALPHPQATSREINPRRFDSLEKAESRLGKDGLTCLHYNLLSIQHKPLYTLIQVRTNKEEVDLHCGANRINVTVTAYTLLVVFIIQKMLLVVA